MLASGKSFNYTSHKSSVGVAQKMNWIDAVGLFLSGATGAAAFAYTLLDNGAFPGIVKDPVWKDSQDSITSLMKKLEGEKDKPDNPGYYAKWETALNDLKEIEKTYALCDPCSWSVVREDMDKIVKNQEQIKKTNPDASPNTTGMLKKDLTEARDRLAYDLLQFRSVIENPAVTLSSITGEFDMKLKELKELEWEIDKLQSALRQNWVDINEHKNQMRRWTVPLYVLVGGAIAVIGPYAFGATMSLTPQWVGTAFVIGGAWTPVAKALNSKFQDQAKPYEGDQTSPG